MGYPARGLLLALVLGCALAIVGTALAQGQSEGIVYIPGHPNSMWVPDPDSVQWEGRQDRPGYRYRGMAPIQEHFYNYIVRKRQSGQQLSWAERSMVAELQRIRRWPEAPVPDDFWRAYMRYLRGLERQELNLGEQLMVAQLISRGYLTADSRPTVGIQRLIDFVDASGARTPRNWFESTFGRVNDWMDHTFASCGYDLKRGGAGDGVFPSEPFNGMQIRYALGGAALGAPTDTPGFTTSRSHEGTLTPGGRLTLTGSVSQRNGYGASASVSLDAGSAHDEASFDLKTPDDGTAAVKQFSLSVDVPADAETGWFRIAMTGDYNAGTRGLTVGGSLRISAEEHAARVAAADAKWREEVERTLIELGYEDTPEGKAIAEMRAALEAGDEAWKAYVDRQVQALEAANDPDTAAYKELDAALEAGGDQWDQYVAGHGGPTAPGGGPVATTAPPATGPTPAGEPDLGGLQVGTGVADGVVQQSGDRLGPVPSVAAAWSYTDVPAGSTCEVVWSCDGKEVARRSREVGGSGWVSFSLKGGDGGNLAPGRYTVTISVGGKVVGRKTFTVG